MAKAKAYKVGAADEPSFPEDFEIVTKAVLQVTDVKSNHNKYYAVELHQAGGKFRVYTHYGRTDDLETNPNAGARETRHFATRPEADACYQQIYREKTGPSKGYREVSLASSKIGSHKAKGTSSGTIDEKTIGRIADIEAQRAAKPKSQLATGIQSLVSYIFEEATNALTSTVAARITAHGIETPLGVLTLGQIEKGEQILQQLFGIFQQGKNAGAPKLRSRLEDLSGDFYSCIPHRLGRTRAAVEEAVIDSMEDFEQKQETLQLMKDMLKVNGEAGSVLFDDAIDAKYQALQCQVGWLDSGSSEFRQVADYVLKSQVKTKSIKVKQVYTLRREQEWSGFATQIGNQRQLFHGSRIRNWVGLLSRGIVMPKIAVGMGVNRTDAGWLGNGIYFGDAACTSAFYTTPGKQGTRFMAVARVALGRMAEYRKITYGLERPPDGYDSCHGVRHRMLSPSQFADDEYVVYSPQQQRLEYLVEFTV